MIQIKHIDDDHPERSETLNRIELSRAAANADLDRSRWHAGRGEGRAQEKQFVPVFAIESQNAYAERLQFLSAPGWTQHVVDAFQSMFDSVEKNLTIDGATADQVEQIKDNIDNAHTPIDSFASHIFRELLITNRVTIPTDREQVAYGYIVPRELLKNWAPGFLTWESPQILSDGIIRFEAENIVIYTTEEFAIAREDGEQYRIISETPNPFGKLPIADIFLHSGQPLILSVAKLEHDFMNLKSEMRKILRDQAGLNILEIDHRADITKLTSTSMIRAKGEIGRASCRERV